MKTKPITALTPRKKKYVDMVKAGIINPVKVVRTALEGAASVAGIILTTEVAICDSPAKDTAGGGMPDMGGMGM